MSTTTTTQGVSVKTSALFSLNTLDILKGIVMAAISAGLVVIKQAMTSPDFWSMATLKAAGIAAVGGCVAYLIKNFFTGTKIVSKQADADQS